jgi:hypothetical protein
LEHPCRHPSSASHPDPPTQSTPTAPPNISETPDTALHYSPIPARPKEADIRIHVHQGADLNPMPTSWHGLLWRAACDEVRGVANNGSIWCLGIQNQNIHVGLLLFTCWLVSIYLTLYQKSIHHSITRNSSPSTCTCCSVPMSPFPIDSL